MRLRALTHPLRWKLIDLIEAEGTATATRCAEVTGESVASCSYHLGMLAKYGYVEPSPAEGRERPWRRSVRAEDLSPPDGGPDAARASKAVVETFLEHQFERIRSRHRTIDREPVEWQRVGIAGALSMWVTPGELEEIREGLMAILRRYDDRVDDPGRRPEGARLATVFVDSAVNPPFESHA